MEQPLRKDREGGDTEEGQNGGATEEGQEWGKH